MTGIEIRGGTIVKAPLFVLLRAYKRFVSPLVPPACRYLPTCSEYAEEALERHGVLRGGALAAWRLLRCHPFVAGGFDPVPIKIGRSRPARLQSH
jgi:uncharacterized protein